MIEKGSPKKLWDDFIELEAFIWSHTAHISFELDGEVPFTRMTQQTD